MTMTIGCNIWMICLKLNWFYYEPRRMLQQSEFDWTLRCSVQVVFNNFLLIDATYRSKISSDQKRLFSAVSLYPFTFFANTPFKCSHAYFLAKIFASFLLFFKWSLKICLIRLNFSNLILLYWTYRPNTSEYVYSIYCME